MFINTALLLDDMKLEEDQNTNRMIESLKLFAEVTSSQWFKNTSVILFLNKDDLFREKLPRSPLSKLFPEYTGGDDYESALKFIESKYKDAFGSQVQQRHDNLRRSSIF